MLTRDHGEGDPPSDIILMTGDTPRSGNGRRRLPLTQETLAILAVGVTLLITQGRSWWPRLISW